MTDEPIIAEAAGVSVGGESAASKAVELAMRTEVLNGISAGDDPHVTRLRMLEARFEAKPPERR